MSEEASNSASVEEREEQLLHSNINAVKSLYEQRGLMHEGAIDYEGTVSQRKYFYGGIDAINGLEKPAGYDYEIRKRYEQVVPRDPARPPYREVTDVVIKTPDAVRGEIAVRLPRDLERADEHAKRGYAKLQMYVAAGKIYRPKPKAEVEEPSSKARNSKRRK